MHPDTAEYNQAQAPADQAVCDLLAKEIDEGLPEAENRIWHAHPVWFLDGNPIVGYSKLKDSVRLFFWSGQSFDEPGLKPSGKFKAAEATEVTNESPTELVSRAAALSVGFVGHRTLVMSLRHQPGSKGILAIIGLVEVSSTTLSHLHLALVFAAAILPVTRLWLR